MLSIFSLIVKTNMILLRNSLWDSCQQSFYLLRTKLHITHMSQYLTRYRFVHSYTHYPRTPHACLEVFFSSSLFRKGNGPWLTPAIASMPIRCLFRWIYFVLINLAIALCLPVYLENAWSRTNISYRKSFLPYLFLFHLQNGISYCILGEIRIVLC